MPKLPSFAASLAFALLIPTVARAEVWMALANSPPRCSDLAAFGEKKVLCIQRNVPSPGQISTSLSTDGGDTWSPSTLAPSGPPAGGVFHWRDETVGFVGTTGEGGAKNGLVWKTANAGKSFELKTLPEEHDNMGLSGVHFAGAVGHAVGAYKFGGSTKALVARSTNDGEAWTDVAFPGGGQTTKETPAAVWTVDATTAIVVTNQGIWRSTDSSATFTKVHPQLILAKGREFIQMFGQVGYVGRLLKTTDGGASWQAAKTPEVALNHIIQAMGFFDANVGVIAQSNTGISNVEGRFWRTLDGTNEYVEETFPAGWGYVPSSVAFSSTGVAYVSGSFPDNVATTPSVVRSSGGGTTPPPGSSSGTTSSSGDAGGASGAAAPGTGGAPAASDDGGCGVARPSAANAGTITLAALAALAVAKRRRRARG